MVWSDGGFWFRCMLTLCKQGRGSGLGCGWLLVRRGETGGLAVEEAAAGRWLGFQQGRVASGPAASQLQWSGASSQQPVT